MNAPLHYTVFTSHEPELLTKVLSLSPEGDLQKQSVACMARGVAQRQQALGLEELARQLDTLQPSQAVSWGIADTDHLSIVPEREADPSANLWARSRQNFQYPDGPGLMMLDHDGTPSAALDADQLRDCLIQACPALAHAPMLWRPSASAGVQTSEGGSLTALSRHRLYIPVRDASRIPEAGKALMTLLWAAGFGWFEVSRAGTALKRSLVDACVWQPERLDFCAPPVLRNGLQRPGVKSRVFGDPLALFDLTRIDVPQALDKAAQNAERKERRLIEGRCAHQRQQWVQAQAPRLAKVRNIPTHQAVQVLQQASAHQVLMGDFMLTASDGTQVSVQELLSHPDDWHNARFADPLDPDHDHRVAIAKLRGGPRAVLFTHRHGGMRFELMAATARIQIGRGLRINMTDQALAVLQRRGELFEFGEGAVAYVAEGKIRTVTQDWLTDHLGRVCSFFSVAQSRRAADGEHTEERAEDAPSTLARAILAKHGQRNFADLVAVITAPTLRLDGTLLDTPGHDAASGLYYFREDDAPLPQMPPTPTPQDALDALRTLWEPFHLFPLVDGVDRGVLVQALLTAVLRPSLPTAPGLGIDAPAAGSGKTLLARCIGILATGTEPAIFSPLTSEEEVRKRLFAALCEGSRVLLWDNLRQELGSAALDAFLTAPQMTDRLLGVSQSPTLPNRTLFMATGNNLRLTSDTCRRVLVARINPDTETPHQRDFDFSPAHLVTKNRQRYVQAALTIVLAHIAAGRPKSATGRTASFEDWDDLVRQPVCWLASLVQARGDSTLPTLADPTTAVTRAYAQDPETAKLTALLEAWGTAFQDRPASVKRLLEMRGRPELTDALEEIAGQASGANVYVNRHVLGHWLKQMEGRIVGGKKLQYVGLRTGAKSWRVVSAKAAQGDDSHAL